MKSGNSGPSARIESKIALEAIKGQQTIQEIASHYGIHPSQVTNWKKQAIQGAAVRFFKWIGGGSRSRRGTLKAELYQQIGKLQMEWTGLKKSPAFTLGQRRRWIAPHRDDLSIRQQCQLGGDFAGRTRITRRNRQSGPENLQLMRLIDQQYTRTPFYGIRRMDSWLGEQGYGVNTKRVRRLIRQMGLEAIYPKPRLSHPGSGHGSIRIGCGASRSIGPNQVWASDITYIRLRQGFIYLVAILDWFSRYVLAWEVSISLESAFCVAALDWALTTTQSGRSSIPTKGRSSPAR